MVQASVNYASPEIAKEMAKRSSAKGHSFGVDMRDNQDVPRFLEKLDEARNKTKQSNIQFD